MSTLIESMRHRVKEIGASVVVREQRLDGWRCRAARHVAPEQYEWIDSDWSTVSVGDIWARAGQTVFMEREVRVPEDWAGLRVALEMRTGGEGMLTVDGAPFHGIDDNRGQIVLAARAAGGESHRLAIEIKTGGYFTYVVGDAAQPFLLHEARLVAVDPDVEAAWYDFRVAADCAAAVRDPVVQEAIVLAMRDALAPVDFRTKSGPQYSSALRAAGTALLARLSEIDFGRHPGTCFFTGHSHIDVAWLWPLKETARKVGRTYSTVTALMDEYPDYHFDCSQVPLFLYLKRYFPAVYDRVRARVADGRFEPIGGTWVENDCNVVSGESFVRQCLYGKRFFRREFGVDVRVGWLPDVFGYSWAMPQIYRKAGIEYFMTSKVAWNESNRLPYNTFWWEGIDGTRLFTQLVHNTMNMYNAHVQPHEMLKQWEDYNSKLACPDYLCPFGFGDGGGGPTREMLEYLPRMASIPGIPHAATGRVHDFFDGIATRTTNLPVWSGEMYFERHRGTYTTHAWNKRCNRKAELLFRDTEMLWTAAHLLGGKYPRTAIGAEWETILLNQFHDIIPGSSIADVYVDSDRDYETILGNGETLRKAALAKVAAEIDTTGPGQAIVLANTLSWDRRDPVLVRGVALAGRAVVDSAGASLPAQETAEGLLIAPSAVPACGVTVVHVRGAADVGADLGSFDGSVLATPYYDITIAADGAITRLYDRAANRGVLPNGARANVLQVFEDKPVRDEAWDVDLSYQERAWEFEQTEPWTVLENGPVRMVLARVCRYGASTLRQGMVLYAASARIDFHTTVDWQERKTMLKVAFPVDVRSPQATFEIAFGAIERPTHRNTSWDLARFEVSGHRWADLSETGYGVSVLNDCKYGWDVEANVIRLTLLRSPESPDPHADRGHHEFTYSLFPHTGRWDERTVRAAHELNTPILAAAMAATTGQLPASGISLVTVDRPNVIIDTVKLAEDSDEVIVRLYEALGARGPVVLTFARAVATVSECDLMEENDVAVPAAGPCVSLDVKPWEIRTLKVRLVA